MIAAPIPSHEPVRLAALHRYHILDTSSEPAFDELARLAAYVCRAPIAVISFVDSSRQWFKSTVGLSVAECPRSEAFCAHTILGTDLFIVEEATADERFTDHRWVAESPSISFYAGVPLITPDGHAIGSLAVMDVVPRTLTPEQCAAMQTLANQVMAQCELRGRRSVRSREETDLARDERKVEDDAYRWQQVFAQAEFGLAYGDFKTNTFLAVNPAFARQRGYTVEELVGQPITMVYAPEERAAMAARFPAIDRTGHLVYESVNIRKDGTTFPVLMEVTVIKDAHGRPMSRVAYAADITVRKQAEEALRLSQERLHQALQASSTGLWDWNTETGEVSFSKEWKSQLGYGESELSDNFETWVSLLHPEDRDRAILYAQRYRDNPVGTFRQDFRLRHKDGSYRWFDSHASFVTEADGRRVRLLGSHTDITERKQAEGALQLAKFTVDHATDAMYWVGADAQLLDVNEAACAMLGYTKEEFGRMSVHDINPHFQADSWPAYWEETRRRGVVTFESVHQGKDGRLIPIEVRVRFLVYEGRECHCAFVRDITERKQVEEERARALNNLQIIMETVPDVIFALDLEGRLSKWNLPMEVVTGYAPIELSGKPALEMVPLEEAERTAAAIREAFETGYAELEGHLLTKDGRMIPYHWTGAPFTDLQGRVIGITGVGRDISERKKAERILAAEKQILEMIGADAPLTDVLGTICRMIEELSDGALCSILLLDADGVHLHHGAAPSLPEAYIRAIDGITIGPMRGSCGTAAFTRRQIIVEDIERDPLWADFRSLALPLGLRACWSMPIISAAGKVLGTFAVYYQTVRSSVGELSAVDRASYLACLAIERAHAQAALRLTRFSIEHAVDAVFWIDSQARILDINDTACRLLGYSREELLSMTVHDIDPSFPAAAWPAHWEDLKTRKSFSFETDHLRKDGTVIQTETTVNFLIHEGQEYNCAFMRDITDRKRAKEVLRMTRFSVERVSDAVFWIDSEARILDVNEAACLSLRYSREELLALHLFEIDSYVTSDNWSRLWQDKLERQSLTFESTQIRKDGTAFPVEITCNHLCFGEQEFCCAIARDISERKNAEGRVKFSEERFRLVAEATNDILWDWDLVTREHWWSPNAREKFGYDDHAEPGISAWTDRLHPDDRERVMAIVDQALASETKTVTAEYRFRMADGSYGYFFDRGQIVRDASGQAIRMIGAMIDVTLSKRAYASLEAAYQRLRSMSRELQAVETNERRRLSRELHDEVGQLLTVLKFDLEASRQALSDKAVADTSRAFERTVCALETTDELFVRLRRVVRALRPSVLEELGLKEALESMVSEIRSRSDLVCSVSVEGTATEDSSTPVIEAALYRMAQELVTNVVRHAQAMTLSVALDADASQWRLTVQDDGVGFNPKAESISGMGIRGVRERAEILGGHVDVSSLPGAGTTITIWIPVQARVVVDDGGNGV